MQIDTIAIPALAGPAAVETNIWTGKLTVTVGGVDVPSAGPNRYALPAEGGGHVEATIKSTLFSPHPVFEIDGTKYPTGPELPVALKIMMLLPFALVIVGGALGGLIGAIGFFVNSSIARSISSATAKTLSMVGVLVAAGLVWFTVASLLLPLMLGRA